MDLFILDDKGIPVPKPELLLIESFSELWKRIRKIDGDADGRKKTQNRKELGYIYFQGKFDSRFKLKKGAEKENAIRKLIGLAPEWIPDELVKQCLIEYVELQVTASSEYVSSLEGTVNSLAKYLNASKEKLDTGNINSVAPREVKELLSIINDSANLLDNITKAKAVLLKEQDALSTGKKGRGLNKFEMPD